MENFKKVENFASDLTGAERLVKKSIKLINRFADVKPAKQQLEDCITAVYLAVVTAPPSVLGDELSEIAQNYFGIKTIKQFRIAYNVVQRHLYGDKKAVLSADPIAETPVTMGVDEIELEMALSQILNQRQKYFLDLKRQGYSNAEISAFTATPEGTIKWYFSKIREIIATNLEVSKSARKAPRVRAKAS